MGRAAAGASAVGAGATGFDPGFDPGHGAAVSEDAGFDAEVGVVGGAAAVDQVVGSGPGGGPDPMSDPDGISGPVIGAGARCSRAGGEPVVAARPGAGARAGFAGPRGPGSGREPLHGARGPVGGSAAERLARARQVLHRVESRSDPERVRPAIRAGRSEEPAGAVASEIAGTAEAADGALLPVPGPLAELLPGGGLRRGSTVAVGAGAGSGSLLFALLSAASAEGAWSGVVGRPGLGSTAAAEAGVRLDRFALVPDPGADLVPVTAALLDGLDLVVVAGPERAGLRATDRQRLMARARQRGAVLLALGSWPGADVRLHCERPSWEGAGRGAGRLRARRVEVRAAGRGIGPSGRGVEVLLPGPGGAVAPVPALAPEIPLPAAPTAGDDRGGVLTAVSGPGGAGSGAVEPTIAVPAAVGAEPPGSGELAAIRAAG